MQGMLLDLLPSASRRAVSGLRLLFSPNQDFPIIRTRCEDVTEFRVCPGNLPHRTSVSVARHSIQTRKLGRAVAASRTLSGPGHSRNAEALRPRRQTPLPCGPRSTSRVVCRSSPVGHRAVENAGRVIGLKQLKQVRTHDHIFMTGLYGERVRRVDGRLHTESIALFFSGLEVRQESEQLTMAGDFVGVVGLGEVANTETTWSSAEVSPPMLVSNQHTIWCSSSFKTDNRRKYYCKLLKSTFFSVSQW